jgi:hypothetical protein
MATVQIGMRIDEELLKGVDAMAERLGVTRTEVLERCIALGLNTSEELAGKSDVALELFHVMSQPGVLKVIDKLVSVAGFSVSPDKVKILHDARQSRKVKKAGKPATE